LWQHMLVGNRLFDLFTDDEHTRVNPELIRIAQRDHWAARASRSRPARGGRRPRRFSTPYRPEVISRLDAAGLLPAITFIFSRAGCDAAVRQCLDAGLRLTTPEEAAAITKVAERRAADIADADLAVLGYTEWLAGLQRGIAAHHAGLLPTFKETVEELFTAGLIRAVFATETLALGINMPARTVVVERLDKWSGDTHAPLTPGEYTQLTGRAGRRGIDVEGHAVVLWQPGIDPAAVAGLAGTRTYRLTSTFQPSYNMAVNLVRRAGLEHANALLEASFAQFQADRAAAGLARQAREGRKRLAELATVCDRGDFAEYARLRRELTELERESARERSAARRAAAAQSLEQLRPGDIIRVPGGRRPGMALVLDPGLAGGPNRKRMAANGAGAGRERAGAGRDGRRGAGPAGSDGKAAAAEGRQPLPLVLTASRQVRRLSLADFPVPVTVVDRIRIPRWFSARSPKHRRDLAAAVRTKVADRDLAAAPRPDRGELAGQETITELRRRLRQHPCHSCPDRDQHARQADQYLRLEQEAERLERAVSGRSHVLARTFQRVCDVLTGLGYLDGETVTEPGQRLADLYTELDLLAAECLRRGLWQGLDAADLAACVSALTFESRRSDEAGPARPPAGQARRVLEEMVSVWSDLDSLEKDHHLSFLREPDLNFAWAAQAWARGKPLSAVLGPDLTPGDFVRAIRQLIDVLGQVAVAAREPSVAATARSAADALRHGVVAYSSVGE
ncbi:MAG: RNA helicase, partial [Actinobacteria bacterium]|nr:RNA helicase [Actinomycetota bacterium]